jgi:3-methyladenine DNA glycosylase/8-oxoguanine DNA glycosylase
MFDLWPRSLGRDAARRLEIQIAIRKNYGLRLNPKPQRIDASQSPGVYCSIASWYLWQSLGNNKPKK